MKKAIIIKLLFIIFLNLSGQNQFTLDTIYLSGKNISMVSSCPEGEVWFLVEDTIQKIFHLDINGNINNRSNEFSHQINTGITDIACVDVNSLLIGTKSDFAYFFTGDTLIHINEEFGIHQDDSIINSIFYKQYKTIGPVKEYVSKVEYAIATSNRLYSGSEILSDVRERFEFNQVYDNRFILSRDDYLMYAKDKSDFRELTYLTPLARYTILKEFDKSEFGDFMCAEIAPTGTPEGIIRGFFWYFIGFEKGCFLKSDVFEYRFLENQPVYSAINYNKDFICGTTDGIYKITREKRELEKIDLGLGSFSAYDMGKLDEVIFIASDTGLIKTMSISCDNFGSTFVQSSPYVDISTADSLELTPELNTNIEKYLWNFGDSSFSTQPTVKHHYKDPGLYEIKLYMSNKYCSDTTNSIVTAYDGNLVHPSNYKSYGEYPFGSISTSTGNLNIIDVDGNNDYELFVSREGIYDITKYPEFGLDVLVDTIQFNKTLWADLNNDGLNDIITEIGFFENLGNLQFNHIHKAFHHKFICLLDYDNDGFLDILHSSGYNIEILINKKNFNFEKLESHPIDVAQPIGCKWIDMNRDNKNDIVITHKNGIEIFFHRNINEYEKHSISINEYSEALNFSVGDLNNDLYPEIYVQTRYQPLLFQYKNNQYHRVGGTYLTDAPIGLNIVNSMGNAVFVDLDNNRYLDCLRHMSGEYNEAFMNYGDLIFKNDLTNLFALTSLPSAAALVPFDIDDNGKMDIIFGYGDGFNTHQRTPNKLYLNFSETENNWISFNLYGTRSNYNAIGTKILIKSNYKGQPQWQTRTIYSSTNNVAQNGFKVHFGLGSSEIVDSLIIVWPSGLRSNYSDIPVNANYNFVEPSIKYSPDKIACSNEVITLSIPFTEGMDYNWYKNNVALPTEKNSITPEFSGTYHCIIKNDIFIDTLPSVDLTIHTVTRSTIFYASSDSTFCPGDSLEISSVDVPNAQYQWYINDRQSNYTNHNVFIEDEGTVFQILTDENGCMDTSNILKTLVNPVPSLNLKDEYYFCAGDTLLLTSQSGFQSYYWSNGDTTMSSKITDSDILLTLSVSNEYGCYNTDTVSVKKHNLPTVNIGPPDTSIYYYENYIPTHTCNYSYSYSWNDSITTCSRNFDARELNIGKHLIAVTVRDTNKCTNSDTTILEIKTGDKIHDELKIFPNPTNGQYLNIVINDMLTGDDVKVDILNSNGIVINSKMYKIKYPTIKKLDIIAYPSGTYYCRITAGDVIKIANFLIQ